MRTSIIFIGYDLEGMAIVEVRNRIHGDVLIYDTIDRCVVRSEKEGLFFAITSEINPLSILDKEIINEWFESKLN